MRLEAVPALADTSFMATATRKGKTKVCTRCGRRRALDEYVRQEKYDLRGRSAGRGSHCLRCRVEATREWRETNREAMNEKKRAYEARPEVKARRKARDRRRRKRIAA